jgi:hypothetical protein
MAHPLDDIAHFIAAGIGCLGDVGDRVPCGIGKEVQVAIGVGVIAPCRIGNIEGVGDVAKN